MKHIDRETEEAVRQFLALTGSRYDIEGAIVYGSRVRGTHRPDSDADVAVLLRGELQRLGRGLGKLIRTMKNGPRPINTSGSSYQMDINMFLKASVQTQK